MRVRIFPSKNIASCKGMDLYCSYKSICRSLAIQRTRSEITHQK